MHLHWLKKKKKLLRLKKKAIILVFIIVLAQVIASVFFYFSTSARGRFKTFKKAEVKEINKLIKGKVGFRVFFRKSFKIFKDFFIPYGDNCHRPRALRAKSLALYLALAILIKVVATGALFFIYPTPAEMSEIVASKIIELTNKSRAENEIDTLTIDPVLSQAALAKGLDMIEHNYFAHNSPEGKKPWQWISKAEYDYVYAGENLAMNFTTAEKIHDAFLASPSHRKNILNEKYQNIGIAVVNGEIDGQNTDLLVVFFGAKREALASVETSKTTAIAPQALSAVPVAEVAPQIVKPVEVAPVTEKAIEPIGPIAQPAEPIAQPIVAPAEISPEAIISHTPQSEGVIVIASEVKSSAKLVDTIVDFSNIAFLAFLIYIVLALTLNIFINIKVQDSALILQSLAVLALISALYLVKFHFIESVAPQLLIL